MNFKCKKPIVDGFRAAGIPLFPSLQWNLMSVTLHIILFNLCVAFDMGEIFIKLSGNIGNVPPPPRDVFNICTFKSITSTSCSMRALWKCLKILYFYIL